MNSMKKLKFNLTGTFLFAIGLLVPACKKESAEILPVDPVQIDITTNQKSLISSQNSFSVDIFKKVLENSAETENIIISPLSISTALSMTLKRNDMFEISR